MVEELRALAARALVNATHGGTSVALRAAGYPEEMCEQVAAHEFCVHFTRAANCSTCALFGRTLTCFHFIPPYVAPSPVSTLACELCEEAPTPSGTGRRRRRRGRRGGGGGGGDRTQDAPVSAEKTPRPPSAPRPHSVYARKRRAQRERSGHQSARN